MNRYRGNGLLFAALAASMAAAPALLANDMREGFEALGMISAGEYEPETESWFTLWEPDIRYVFRPAPASAELWALILRANEDNRSVAVRYAAAGGHVNEAEGTVDYPVCAVTLDDVEVRLVEDCGSSAIEARSGASSEGVLALGLAELMDGDAGAAHQWLDMALATGPDSPLFRGIALRARAGASAALAYEEEPWSQTADRASIAALTDYRELARLTPDDVEVRFSIATTLEELGAYSAAEAGYEAILQRWPDESYRVAVRRGALYRRQGDNERALEQLDRLVEREGPQDGMRFHYHRGWTLTNLGRFDEAVAEFDKGIPSQPDYSWAHIRRACANASIGELPEALEDLERGGTLLADVPSDSAAVAHDIRRVAAIGQDVRSLIASGEKRPFPNACGGFWGRAEEARARSPLLESPR